MKRYYVFIDGTCIGVKKSVEGLYVLHKLTPGKQLSFGQLVVYRAAEDTLYCRRVIHVFKINRTATIVMVRSDVSYRAELIPLKSILGTLRQNLQNKSTETTVGVGYYFVSIVFWKILAVFWDIYRCASPAGKDAAYVTRVLEQKSQHAAKFFQYICDQAGMTKLFFIHKLKGLLKKLRIW
jgi:hypothetical protein